MSQRGALRPSSTLVNISITGATMLSRQAKVRQRGGVLLTGDLQVTDLAAGRLGDLPDSVGESQQPGPGQLVGLAGVPIFGKRGDRDIGDVLDVDERLGHVSPAGNATSPARTGSSKKYSLKFWKNQLARTIVHSAPESRTACSLGKTAAHRRGPTSSTSRRTPLSAASSAKRTDRVGSALGSARFG